MQFVTVIIPLSCVLLTCQLNAQMDIRGTLSVDGMEREYLLYVPANHTNSEPVPLVLNFHGYTSTAEAQRVYGDFRRIADREQFLIVHPQGTLGADGETYFNADWVENGVDDVAFTAALIDHLADNYEINLDRVYSTGMSNGGFMSYTLACELSDRIAAIASVTGSMVISQLDTCDPDNAVPVMEIHGTGDAVVPYEGNNWMAPIDAVISFWAVYNDCASPLVTNVPDSDPDDESTVERHLYSGCTGGKTIELFKITNGGHTWPGSSIDFGVTNYDINASEEIWRFFSQYDLNGPISSDDEVETNLGFTLYPSLVMDQLTIEFDADGNRGISIIGLDGETWSNFAATKRKFIADTTELPSGYYIVQVVGDGLMMTKSFVRI